MTEITSRLSAALADRYKIERRLGAGGMATVYLAEDLKHKRKVAVKVLRPELAAVLGAERFVQEITTTANLQHPNILPLFDSGEADGFLYYVMPYIEGETLRDKLNRETQLGIEEAVKITTEVAEALDSAHQQGVIHRDIKPENILLHKGRPMVADFGIALAVSAAAGGRMTETGLSLGTPHYMSPEQATAEKEITARSDVYSLGSVLYEMLTGDPPHTGSSAQQIIMKIVTEEVPPVTNVRKSVPPNLAAATAKSLEKLPADRFDSAARFSEALANPAFTVSTTHAPALARGPSRRSWNRVSVVTVTLAVVLLGTTLWGWLRDASGPTPSVTRFVISPTAADGTTQRYHVPPALSPDGRKLVYAVSEGDPDTRGLYLRMLDRFDAVLIPGTEGAITPFFSPDGEWVGFWADGSLRKVLADGGPVVTIAESGPVSTASWGSDDRIVFAEALTGLRHVSASGGTAETLTALDFDGNTDVVHFSPVLVPGTDAVLFTSATPGSVRTAVASMDTGEWHVLFEGSLAVGVAPTGHLLFRRRDGSLWAVQFDAEGLEIGGEPVLVMDQAIAWAAFAENGTMVFGVPNQVTTGELTWVDRNGVGTPLEFPHQRYLHPRVSPDGRQVAVTIREPGSREAVWILDLERLTRTRFTAAGGVSRWPVWTHDGTRIAFVSDRETAFFDLYSKPVDGSGEAQALLTTETLLIPLSWSEDLQTLSYYEVRSAQADIWALPTDGEPVSVVSSPFDERGAMFSPDGRWLAYVSNESGQDEVYVRPYPGPGAPMPVSNDGGIEPVWSRDGGELYFRHADRMMTVPVSAGGMLGVPQEVFRQDYALSPIGRGNANFDVAADGRFLMVRRIVGEGPREPIHVVLNFFEELKAKVGN